MLALSGLYRGMGFTRAKGENRMDAKHWMTNCRIKNVAAQGLWSPGFVVVGSIIGASCKWWYKAALTAELQ